MKIGDKLALLREQMHKVGIDYYYIPSSDPHQSEYVPTCWQRRQWISGFTGSAGDVLVGLDKAYLWTDARYFLQAEQELDLKHFALMKDQVQGATPPIDEWLKRHAYQKRCGVDPTTITLAQANNLSAAMASVEGKLSGYINNLVDQIWQDRGELPVNPIACRELKWAGVSAQDKIAHIRDELAVRKAEALVITTLDSIAWLYNIRGSDIEYNPLAISYAVVTAEEALLFIDSDKINAAAGACLKKEKITIKPYEAIAGYLSNLTGRVWLDPDAASWWVAQQLTKAQLLQELSPIKLLQACKNKVELDSAKEAHRKDGIALCRFIHWLEKNWKGQDELTIMDRVYEFRAEDPDFKGLSFTTICGYAGNGAIVHYRSTPKTAKKIADDALLLIDSGAQYTQGTTDVTRSFHFGKPTQQEKHHYTLVLKGHLAIRHMEFPLGTRGEHLDAFSRQFLWREGLNFGHGTGHGVGVYLCVHEGPQRISGGATNTALQPGMLVSNEPGIYLTGEYGIRIENVCAIHKIRDLKDSLTGHGPFLSLEDLTLVPYNRKLIDKSLLTDIEIEWINSYHRKVLHALHDDLPKEVQKWLETETKPL